MTPRARAPHAPPTTGAVVSAGDAALSLPPRGAGAAPARHCCFRWQGTTRLRPEPASRVTAFGQEHAPAVARAGDRFRHSTGTDACLRSGDLSDPRPARDQRCRRPARAATRASGGRVAEAVRKEPRAAHVPALRSLPLRERSSRPTCRQWAARSGREQHRGVGSADCCSAEPGRRVVPRRPFAEHHGAEAEQARRRRARCCFARWSAGRGRLRGGVAVLARTDFCNLPGMRQSCAEYNVAGARPSRLCAAAHIITALDEEEV